MNLPDSIVTDTAISAARACIMRAASKGGQRQAAALALTDYLIGLPMRAPDEQQAFILAMSQAAETLRGDMEKNGIARP